MNRTVLRSFVKDTGSAVGDIFLPRTCVVCGRRLLMRERYLCLSCAADLPLTRFWEMDHNAMADKLNALIERRLSASSVAGPSALEPYARAAALFYYNSQAPYRKIPQALKYQGAIGAGRHFARMLGECLAGSALFSDVRLVVPVPLHWTRRRKRGYNQAAVIAKEVAALLGASLDVRILRRRRRTRTQTRLSVTEKAANVGGAFAVRPRRFDRWFSGSGEGMHVLLVDDVFTTGATLEACYEALRSALACKGIGPDRVRISVATLAFVGQL